MNFPVEAKAICERHSKLGETLVAHASEGARE